MESIIKKAMSISNKGVILTCNSANHQNIQLTAKVYQSADVINLALMNGKNIDFKHYCKAIDDKDYFAMMGVLIHS